MGHLARRVRGWFTLHVRAYPHATPRQRMCGWFTLHAYTWDAKINGPRCAYCGFAP